MNAPLRSIETQNFERRSITLDLAAVRAAKDEDRVVDASVSSEEPYQRWGNVKEILDHRPEAVDLGRAAKGLALLLHHDPTKIIGIAEDFRIKAKKLRARLRFGRSEEASSVWEDVRAGILRHLSVGYTIEDSQQEGSETLRVTRWTPHEVSLVAIPADTSVGIGRSAIPLQRTPPPMTTLPNPNSDASATERTRVADILAIGKQFDMRDDAESAVREGVPVDAFRNLVLDKISSRQSAGKINGSNRIGLLGNSHEQDIASKYSFGRAVTAMITNDWSKAGFEREMSKELASRAGRTAQGVFIPSISLAKRAVQTVSGTPTLVGTDFAWTSFIDSLVNEAVVLKAGATRLPGLIMDVTIPKQTGNLSASWYAEDSTITESSLTIGQVSLSPKQCSGRASYSKKLLVQSLPSIEALVQNDLRRQIALAIDLAAINGSGTSNEPQGVINTSGINTIELGTNGAAPTWDMIVDLMKGVATDNALSGALGYVSNFAVLGKLQKTPRQSSGIEGNFIMNEATERLNGFASYWSNQVPATFTKGSGSNLSGMIFGNWADLLIGEWGAIDLVIDPYSDGAKGNVRIYAHAFVDVAVRNAQSFAVCDDIVTT